MRNKTGLAMLLAVLLVMLLPLSSIVEAKTAKKKYANFQEVAIDMETCFQRAIKSIEDGDSKAAYKAMNDAYFGHYEIQGFEKYVMVNISAKRVSKIEGMFRDIKHSILGNIKKDNKEIINNIKTLSMCVCRDALILDGVVGEDAPEEEGLKVLKGTTVTADAGKVKLKSFFASFGLLIREGLEAILVCMAIITYLIKSGNKQLCKGVYLGMLAGVVGSGILAVLIDFALKGVGQELMEGWTMFLAVAVLFYVSHWMLHQSEEHAWNEYINRAVQKSIDKRNQYVLIGSAFLAVIREGAELILFYKATLSGGTSNGTYAFFGFVAGAVVLAAIYFIMRYTTVRLPLRPFFLFTSILLFLMCFTFIGKGVQELTEAGFISGATTLPFMNGFNIPDLGFYDRAETMLPQMMIVIASLWLIIGNHVNRRRAIREAKAKAAAAATAANDHTETPVTTAETVETTSAEKVTKA